ncbi:MAG: adenylyltransferase/cytidyltransferase family protein [Thermoanaerobaculia bacterium]
MNAPIVEEEELAKVVAEERRAGRTIAFANGVFDILHVGHIRYLQGAAAVADRLIVAVNSDESVRMLKGEGRPTMADRERAEIVSAIRGVSWVIIFREKSPARLLGVLRPDFQTKGTDYTEDSVPEASVVRGYGGKVVIVGDPKDHSTTEMLERMKKNPGG